MTNKINVANPRDKGFWTHSYLLWFGAYGDTKILAYADSLDRALDYCVDWLETNAPGLLADEQVNEEYTRALAENGGDEEAAVEAATVDTTCAGNCDHYLLSWEWGLVGEDLDRAELISIARGR